VGEGTLVTVRLIGGGPNDGEERRFRADRALPRVLEAVRASGPTRPVTVHRYELAAGDPPRYVYRGIQPTVGA